jgi:hypothetical protein
MISECNLIKQISWIGFILLVLVCVVHFGTLDGLPGVLGIVFAREDTVYSAGYSNAAFRRIREGMTRDQVRDILGDPLETRTDPWATRRGEAEDCWAFSTSPGYTNYRIRLVCFDKDGRVVWSHSSFWFD